MSQDVIGWLRVREANAVLQIASLRSAIVGCLAMAMGGCGDVFLSLKSLSVIEGAATMVYFISCVHLFYMCILPLLVAILFPTCTVGWPFLYIIWIYP